MKYLLTFWHILKKSLSSFDYYNEIAKAPFKLSFKYFLVLSLFAALITTVQLSQTLLTTTKSESEAFFSYIKRSFPEDLEIKIENGQATFNKAEALIIENSKELREQNPNLSRNLIILDENGVIEDIKTKDAIMLFNKTNLIVKQNENFEIISLSELPNTIINKQSFLEDIEKIDPLIKALPYVMVFFTFIAAFAYYFGIRTFYLIGISAVLLGFVMIVRKRLGFGKLYQFAIHAMTAPLLVEIVMSLTGTSFGQALWFPILNIVIAMVGIMHLSDDIN